LDNDAAIFDSGSGSLTGKKDLFFAHLRTDRDKAGAGFAGVELFFPAGVARPAPAEHALAEL
jgi:hypothetical protein